MKIIREHKFIAVCVLAALIIVLGMLLMLAQGTNSDSEEHAASLRQAVYDRALQCYVIEGSYPESLSYLEQNYGLAVNHEDYLVVYTPFAENMPPDIRVIPRHG